MSAIVDDHKNFLDTYGSVLAQCQVNYSFLAGDHNKALPSRGDKVFDTVYKETDSQRRSMTLWSFDKIEDSMREILPSMMEAVPGVGVVPLQSDPVKTQNQDFAEKFIEYHRDKIWCSERFVAHELLPHSYAGGAAYVLMYPKATGTIRVPTKDGEPYMFHGELPVKVNTDGSLNVGGKDLSPEEIGVKIEDRPQVLMDLSCLTVFDVSVGGSIKKSLRDADWVTVKAVKSLGELVTMFPDKKDEIDSLEMTDRQEKESIPQTGAEKYFKEIDFPTPQYGTLTGYARKVEVYQKFTNPCYEYPSGRVETVATGTQNGEITLADVPELPWKHPKTKKGLIPMAWFPMGLLKFNGVIPQSDIQKAEGAQRARDRMYNAAMSLAAYAAQPPILYEDGTQFKKGVEEWFDIVNYPVPGEMLPYKRRLGSPEGTKPFDTIQIGQINPQVLMMIDEALMSALHVRANVQGAAPKSVSGESVQLQYTIEKRDLTPIQRSWEGSWFELYELLIAAATTEYYEKQPFIIQDADSYSVMEFKQEIFGDDYDYVLVSRLNQPVTMKQRIENTSMLMQMFAQIGQLPEEMVNRIGIDKLMEIADLSRMGFMANERNPNLVKAQWENAQMSSGKDVKPPNPYEDHIVHLKVVLNEIQDVRFLRYNETIQGYYIAHADLHLKELGSQNRVKGQLIQQQAQQQEVDRQQLQIQNQKRPDTPGEPIQEPNNAM